MKHEDVRELLPAYALDALAPEEARAVEAHLLECDECRGELAAFREVAGALAGGVAMANPPADLRGKVLAAARPDRGAGRSAGWPWGLAAAAALIVLLAATSAYLAHRVTVLTARLTTQERVLALLASPTAQSAVLSGSVQANVRFVYDRARGQGALVVSGLGDPGEGFVYELWLVAGKEPQSAGVFRPIPGQPIIVPVTADFGRYQAVAISVERGPQGAPRPTTAPILAGAL